MTRYTYGDSELAGDRLGLVARLFEPTSRVFLEAAAPRAPRLAVDLGCGPGHTTALVRTASGAGRTIGIDHSEAFVQRARGAGQEWAFVEADVTARFLPIVNADLLYARLLLAHLTDPSSVVERWSMMLTIAGRVLIDDLEAIETDEDVFRSYLDDVALAVIRAQGGALFVGPELHAAADPSGLARVHDGVATFVPTAAETARIFGMNLAVLTERGEVAPQPSLNAALEAIARGARSADPVRWRVRQLAWERTG